MPEFGISIGLFQGQEPVMGIIAMPALGQIIASQKGKGVQLLSLDGTVLGKINNSPTPPLDQTLVGYDLGYSGRGDQLKEGLTKLSDKIGYPVTYGSSSTANFRLAMGNIGAYFCKTPTKFDIGAASAIITELGGLVTDMSGNPINWQARSTSYLAARSPQIHQQILQIINNS